MNLLRAWNRFWFQPTSARPLATFRIVTGMIVLVHLVMISVDLEYWLTDKGLLQGAEARELAGPFRPSPLQWIQDPLSVKLFVAATAVSAVCVTIGWRTRASAIVLYLMLLSIHHRNIPTNCGPDNLLLLCVFYLMLSPCGATLSLDARRTAKHRGTLAEPLILPWSQRLIQLQLCLIYFDTSILKCNGGTWLGGTALHYVLHNPEVGRYDLTALAQYPVLINLLTITGLLIEFGLAFFLWFRATRPFAIVSGILLHGGVLLIVNAPLFGELMIACYLTFLEPDEINTLLHAINPFHWFRKQKSAGAIVPRRVDRPEGIAGPHSPVPVGVSEHAIS